MPFLLLSNEPPNFEKTNGSKQLFMEEIFSLKVENADGKFWRRLFEYFFHDQPKLLGGSFDLHFP